MNLSKKLILASGSPRRKELLSLLNIPFEIKVSEADESFPDTLLPESVPEYIARNKANAVQPLVEEDALILSADTIVVVDDNIIGKPCDIADAKRMLGILSGRTHIVYTGVVLMQNQYVTSFTDRTDVEFHRISEEEINYYVDEFRPLDKAGAYGIQDWIGLIGIKKITGDFYNVMGLPVSRVYRQLNNFLL